MAVRLCTQSDPSAELLLVSLRTLAHRKLAFAQSVLASQKEGQGEMRAIALLLILAGAVGQGGLRKPLFGQTER